MSPTASVIHLNLGLPTLLFGGSHGTKLFSGLGPNVICATGPDEIPMEVFKELDRESLEKVAEILNIWWENEQIDEDFLKATVCLIYNYRW